MDRLLVNKWIKKNKLKKLHLITDPLGSSFLNYSILEDAQHLYMSKMEKVSSNDLYGFSSTCMNVGGKSDLYFFLFFRNSSSSLVIFVF